MGLFSGIVDFVDDLFGLRSCTEDEIDGWKETAEGMGFPEHFDAVFRWTAFLSRKLLQ